MSKDMQFEEKCCKNCIHYKKCVQTFRGAKSDGFYLDIEEDEYFAHADGCDFYADRRVYRKQSEGEWVDQYQGKYDNQLYKCSECGETAFHDEKRWFLTHYCPNCGAKMKGCGGT